MASPMKQLFIPKLISPLSPRVQQKLVDKYACTPRRNNSISKARRNLSINFEEGNLKRRFKSSSDLNKLGLQVTNRALLINTTNKSDLLQNGFNFVKTQVLGKGSFGTVVKGLYKGEIVAVKLVKIKSPSSTIRDANALCLNHDNIIKIFDVALKAKDNYGVILMEYLPFSQNLQSVLDDDNLVLEFKNTLQYAIQISKALKYCHENKILHLDVKPNNILVCGNNSCKLCDFGNSIKVAEVDCPRFYQGTIPYSAPELLSGELPTAACDVFSLGITLWQMRFREVPYSTIQGVEVIIYKVVKFNMRPYSFKNVIKDKYFDIYTNCWSGNPKERSDLNLIISQLEELLVIK